MFAAPQTLAALIELSPLPSFHDDPTRHGMVVLDNQWVADYIIFDWFPLIGQRHCHKAMAAPLYAALAEIANSPFAEYIKPKTTGIFVPRRIGWKAGNRLSLHALALAIDINWDDNPFGTTDTSIRNNFPWIIEVFRKHGFVWGGDWKTPDDMHFQFVHSGIRLPR